MFRVYFNNNARQSRSANCQSRQSYAESRRRLSAPGLLLLALSITMAVAGALTGLATIVDVIQPVHAYGQDIDKLNRFVQDSKSSGEEVKIFREGRDLISDGAWENAARLFQEYASKYPNSKDLDAALYWQGYALAKLAKFEQATRVLNRLLDTMPRSSWRRDAEALRVQLPNANAAESLNNPDDEIKIVAFQSLIMGNPEQGTAQGILLLNNPKSSAHLKEAVVSLIGQHPTPRGNELLVKLARGGGDSRLRKTATFWLGQSDDESTIDLLKDLTADADHEVGKAALFAISQHRSQRVDGILTEIARSASNPLRREAIFWISQRDTPASDDVLIQILNSEQDREVRKQVIFALSQRRTDAARAKLLEIAKSGSDRDVRMEAIFWVGQRGDDQSADELIRLLDAERDLEVRKRIVFSISQTNNPKTRAKLMDLVRGSGDPELRAESIFWIAQTGDDKTMDFLIQLYDSEKAFEVKKKILFALSQHHSKATLHKLMAIAKSDSSPELRKEAVFWLGQSGDPEALKFLEDLLK